MQICFEPLFRVAACAAPRAEAAQLEVLSAAFRAAEADGIARVWVVSEAGRVAPSDAIRLCVMAAAESPDLRCVAAGIDAERSSWIRLAEDGATADGLLDSRLELCFREPVPEARSIARIREAWAGGAPALPSDATARTEVHPRPAHPDGPLLWAMAPHVEAARAAAQGELRVVVRDVLSALAFAEAVRRDGSWSSEIALDRAAGLPADPFGAEALRADLEPLARAGIERVTVRVGVPVPEGGRGGADEGAAESVLGCLREVAAAN